MAIFNSYVKLPEGIKYGWRETKDWDKLRCEWKPPYYSGVGKCPNGTPKYWGYNLQQIFESDVQNSQNGTFTKPWVSLDKTWQNETPKQRIRCPGATDGMAMAMAMTWEVGVRKKSDRNPNIGRHWNPILFILIHFHQFSETLNPIWYITNCSPFFSRKNGNSFWAFTMVLDGDGDSLPSHRSPPHERDGV